MRLRVNCGDDATCGCGCTDAAPSVVSSISDHRRLSYRSNVEVKTYRREVLDGREYLVIPVVMMRSDVVMNGALVPDSEIRAFAWNGVPVTVDHPATEQGNITANSPQAMEQWSVGQIFNAYVTQGALKGEAWIDVAKANARHPDLIDTILTAETMDVSTGFYSVDIPTAGESRGRAYSVISTNLIPDHLALLPNDTGACSWEDGCGVRNKQEKKTMSKRLGDAMSKLLSAIQIKANERGRDDDWRQMIADLISNDSSPFVPDDLDALSYMSLGTLTRLRDGYLGAPSGDDSVTANGAKSEEAAPAPAPSKAEASPAPAVNSEPKKEAPAMDTSKEAGQEKTITLSANELEQLISSRVDEAIKANSISAEDRAALENARAIVAEQRQRVVERIVANSAMTEDQLKDMDTPTLEVIANGLRPATDYSGRVVPIINAETAADPAVAAMTSTRKVDELIANRRRA